MTINTTQVCEQVLDTLITRFQLREVHGRNGGDFHPFTSPQSGQPAGGMRLWDGGDSLLKVVSVRIQNAQPLMNTFMLFALTKPDSLVPGFTLESIFMSRPGPGGAPAVDVYAFHLDLIPKCDLGVNLPYIQRVYEPLSDVQQKALNHPGISAAVVTATQRAVTSPWTLAQRATAEAFTEVVEPTAQLYFKQWLAVQEDGLTSLAPTIRGMDVAQRDSENRRLIFSAEVDPVLPRLNGMIGPQSCAAMISVLTSSVVEQAL